MSYYGASIPLLFAGQGGGGGGGLPLDDVSGATFAVSTRKLRTAYAGSAIRVRRSSDNTEQDIGFSGNDLDTASLLSFVGAGDGFIVRWYDQSTTGHQGRQTTSGNQPQIVSSGAVITNINSLPSILFDGTDDVLLTTNSSGTNQDISNYIGGSAYTVFAVYRLISISSASFSYGGGSLFTDGGDGSANSYFGLYTTDSDSLAHYNWDGGEKNALNVVSTGTNYIAEARLESSNIYLKNSGVGETSTASAGPDDITDTGQIGGGDDPYDGYIGEIIVYNSALSSGDRTTLNTNISTYWGI